MEIELENKKARRNGGGSSINIFLIKTCLEV